MFRDKSQWKGGEHSKWPVSPGFTSPACQVLCSAPSASSWDFSAHRRRSGSTDKLRCVAAVENAGNQCWVLGGGQDRWSRNSRVSRGTGGQGKSMFTAGTSSGPELRVGVRWSCTAEQNRFYSAPLRRTVGLWSCLNSLSSPLNLQSVFSPPTPKTGTNPLTFGSSRLNSSWYGMIRVPQKGKKKNKK